MVDSISKSSNILLIYAKRKSGASNTPLLVEFCWVDLQSGPTPSVLLSAGLRLDPGLGSDLGGLDSHLDLGFLGDLGLLG